MLVGVANVIETTYGNLKLLPRKELEKIGTGEHNLHIIKDVQCITVPFLHYMKVVIEAHNGKKKRK
jgi:hypothetical protein